MQLRDSSSGCATHTHIHTHTRAHTRTHLHHAPPPPSPQTGSEGLLYQTLYGTIAAFWPLAATWVAAGRKTAATGSPIRVAAREPQYLPLVQALVAQVGWWGTGVVVVAVLAFGAGPGGTGLCGGIGF